MISLEEARKKVLSVTRILNSEEVSLFCSLGRTLAKDVHSSFDIPRFNRAAMDGYAVVPKDLSDASFSNPVILKMVADLPAGKTTNIKLKSGCCVRIMTGAPIPEGADAVVMLEDTEEIKKENFNKTHPAIFVKIFHSINPGENIAFAGEDVKKEEIVLCRGIFIRAPQLAMLAAIGKTKVEVTRKPHIAIISTGDEIIEPGTKLKKGQIYDSNSYGLWAQVLQCGGEPYRLGIVGDNKRELKKVVKESLKFDILLLSGGVSEGVYDIVVEVLKELGVRMLFWKVAVKPGKPTFFGKKGRTLVFGLPGYPVSSMLNFEYLVRPAIFKMLGRKDFERIRVRAILSEPLINKGDRVSMVRVKLLVIDGRHYASLSGCQKSGVLKSLVNADGIVLLPKGTSLRKGKEVSVEIL